MGQTPADTGRRPVDPTGRVPLAPGTVPNYLVQSILVTLCCCIPFGIVAIVFSAQVNGKLTRGDYEGAVKASDRARKWAWISFGSGIAVIILYFIATVIGA